jgi:hypothetical protein
MVIRRESLVATAAWEAEHGAAASSRERESLGLTRRIHGLERVADEALRAADRARHVKPAIEAPEILRGLERFLERGLGEAERRREALELAGIDFLH